MDIDAAGSGERPGDGSGFFTDGLPPLVSCAGVIPPPSVFRYN